METWNSWKRLEVKYKIALLVWALFMAVCLAIIFMLLFYMINDEYSHPSAAVKDYLYRILQTNSETKPFEYTIVSASRAKNPSLAGDVWCFVITPPVKEANGGEQEDHFLVVFSNPQWVGLRVPDKNRKAWIEEGCGSW